MKRVSLYSIFVFSLILLFSFQKIEATDCPASVAGNYTLSSSCIIPSGGHMDVVDGNLTIDSGVTLTMDTNARLSITSGKTITVNGSISLASGAYIAKKNYDVVLNSATDQACSDKCPSGYSCSSIGQDSYGTDTYYWKVDACSGGSCPSPPPTGDCSTVMSKQCDPANKCCDIEVYWTRCLCIED